jgi:hypothetical protein
MTTIDERLESIAIKASEDIQTEAFKFWQEKTITNDMLHRNCYDIEQKAKAAIRKLFLDLIAEAKPMTLDTIPMNESRKAIERYENNLIQAINGGKK